MALRDPEANPVASVVAAYGAWWTALRSSWDWLAYCAGTTKEDQVCDQLLESFQRETGTPNVADSAREVFALLQELLRVLRWNDGLREALSDIILFAVQQAERFGAFRVKTGEFKRWFVVDVAIRILRRYHYGGLPFLQPIEDAMRPFVGIFVDWTVAILNLHEKLLWPQ